jgi:hypothetical protein
LQIHIDRFVAPAQAAGDAHRLCEASGVMEKARSGRVADGIQELSWKPDAALDH